MSDIGETHKARTVLEHAKSSVKNFLETFDTVREARGAGQGAPTDEEQDLLRAALVFAAAGLDSALKELVRASVRPLARVDQGVQEEFETFVQRQLRGDSEEIESVSGYKFLAGILSSSSPQDRLLNEYVLYLTGTSLQSVDQLFRTAKALGVETKILAEKKGKLVSVFDVRNKIIHELDVRFAGKRGHRQRNGRRKADLQSYADTLLDIAEAIICRVEEKLKTEAPANHALQPTPAKSGGRG